MVWTIGGKRKQFRPYGRYVCVDMQNLASSPGQVQPKTAFVGHSKSQNKNSSGNVIADLLCDRRMLMYFCLSKGCRLEKTTSRVERKRGEKMTV
jgi:hypothetical protein